MFVTRVYPITPLLIIKSSLVFHDNILLLVIFLVMKKCDNVVQNKYAGMTRQVMWLVLTATLDSLMQPVVTQNGKY